MMVTAVRWEPVSEGRTMAQHGVESEERMTEEMGSNPSVEEGSSAAPPASALVPGTVDANNRSEFLARIKTIIDNATAAVRAMKEENSALARRIADLEEKNGALESRVHLLTSTLTREETALQQSVAQLEALLQAASAPASVPEGTTEEPPQATAAAALHEETDTADAATEVADTAAAAAETPAATAAEPPQMAAAPADEEEPVAVREVIAPEPDEQAVTEAPVAGAEAEAPDAEAATGEPEAPPENLEPQTEAAEAAPEPAAAETEPAAPVTTGGVYTLITYPFVRFSDLGQFQAALQRLRGVHDVQVRRFAQGTLEMTARYEGETDLATALRSLDTEIADVSEEAPYRLRVRLRSGAEG